MGKAHIIADGQPQRAKVGFDHHSFVTRLISVALAGFLACAQIHIKQVDLVISGQQAAVWSKQMAPIGRFPTASLQKGRADQQMHAEGFSLLSIPVERFGFILKQGSFFKSGAVAL